MGSLGCCLVVCISCFAVFAPSTCLTGERLVHLVGFGCLRPFLNLLACFQACPNHCQKRQAVMRCKQEGEQTSCRCSFSYFAHQPSLLHDFSGMDAWARLQTLT